MTRTFYIAAALVVAIVIIYCLLPQPTVRNCHQDEVPCINALHPPRH